MLNVFKKKQKVEMFSVCERNMKVMIPIDDLKDKSKWLNGWVGKNDNVNFG